MSGSLAGKIALITGAAGGIGKATAELFEQEGASVVRADIQPGSTVHLDVTSEADWQSVLDGIARDHGRLDILVNAAGVPTFQPLLECDLATFRQVTAVNLDGPFMGSRLAAALMRKQGTPAHGVIINISSLAVDMQIERTGAYGVTKAALTNLSRAMGVEFGRKGDFIRVVAIHPGPVRTPMLETVIPPADFDKPATWSDVPLEDYARPEDIAETILYAASNDGRFLTSTVLTVDGGIGHGVNW